MRPTDALLHPGDWGTTTVGKGVEVKRGVSWSKDQEHAHPRDDRVPVIRIGNVQRRLKLDDLMYLSDLKPAVVKNKRVTSGWAVIVGSNGNRARVGNAVLVRTDADFLFASFLIGAKPKADSGLSPEYFYRWLSSEQVQAYLSSSSEGTTGLNNLSHSFFKAMAIPVPPPGEQAAIARILDAVDLVLERSRTAVERARALRACILADLLSHGVDKDGKVRLDDATDGEFVVTPLGMLPSAWRLSTVEREFNLQNGFTLNPDRRPRFKRRRYLRVANVQRDALSLTDVQELEAGDAEFAPRELAPGDLLVVEGHADRMEIGRCARVNEHAAGMTFQNHLFRLRTKGRAEPAFASLWLNSAYAQRYWNARCATSSGLNTINQRTLKRLVIPLPSKPEQQSIASIVDQQRQHLDALIAKQVKVEALKSSLMHDLITGRVRITNEIEAVVS
jgi:type I restriction enzyme S subunit